MAKKEDFSPEEWKALITTPIQVSAAMILASPSGPIGLIQESVALGKAMDRLVKKGSANLLMNDIAQSFKAQIEKGKAGQEKQPFEMPKPRDFSEAKQQAIDSIHQAMGILKAKAAPEDVNAYREFTITTAHEVAEAAKEGGFLGVGGKKLSDQEQTLLNDLKTAFES